jgi:hypothetical protein
MDAESGFQVGMFENEDTEDRDAVVNVPRSDHQAPSTPKKKRRVTKASTPIVDDEVRRSSRFRNVVSEQFFQLDNEPRRRKGEAKKTVKISTIQDLKKCICSGQFNQNMEIEDVEPISSSLLVSLGTGFCGVPPEELTEEDLLHEDPK